MIKDKLLKVDENNRQAKPTEFARTIDSFLHLITRDKGSSGDHDGRKKRRASKEFSYIYFMYDPKSTFFDIPDEDERHSIIKRQLFGEDSNWEPDESVKAAAEDYIESSQTISTNLLKSSYKAVDKVRKYLESVDLTEEDDNGKLKYSVKDVTKTLSDLGSLIDGLEKLENRIRKELNEKSDTRGGVKRTEFNT